MLLKMVLKEARFGQMSDRHADHYILFSRQWPLWGPTIRSDRAVKTRLGRAMKALGVLDQIGSET